MKHKFPAFLLALVLAVCLPVQALAAKTEPAEEPEEIQWEELVIRTPEDLLDLARHCSLDSWSQNKRVRLEADIDLEGREFAPIPSFGGCFEGGGHIITGLRITQCVAPAGLFGCIQKTGIVRGLRVRGDVTPGGDCAATGGIAGENEGTIESCSFSGKVAGRTNTGGIAGSSWGLIQDCSTQGEVTGSNRTGGIAGYNDGKISGSRNDMAVNTQSVDPVLDPSRVKLDFSLDFSKTADLDLSDAATDTGGVAGYSDGTLADCVNTGSVGYPHIGYNLGGIAGRNSGFVERCENRGSLTGRKDVGGIVGQIEPHVQTVLSEDYLETLSKQFESLGGLVSRAGSNGASTGGNIQDHIETISGYQDSAKAALRSIVSKDGINKDAVEELGSSIRGIARASGGLKNAIGEGVGTLTQDVSAISGQIRAISRTFALATEEMKEKKVEDMSDLELDGVTEGRVRKCVNTGFVEADLNVGGITGVMGMEATADPEDDRPNGNLTQRRRYELKSIVDSCENIGTVQGKRSYVGGICGRMELGLIIDSRGYGHISSEDGDYVGGIAGLAGGTVRNCVAKCSLSGVNYIGGIVGSGIQEDVTGDASTVTGCYSMVEVEEAKQYVGAVAGANNGVFFGNYFVSDTLAGINRVSYQDQAEPVSYEKMQSLQAMPQSIKELTLRFVADGQSVKTVTFHYGDSFDSSVFPEIPQKEGCYARWSIRKLEDLRFDTVVEANYLPFITALHSEAQRPGERPVFFVQGKFQEGDSLTVSQGQTAYHPAENATVLEQWHLAIPADGLQTHTIRYLPPQAQVQLYLLRSGSWSRVTPEEMGTYLAFEGNGAEVELAVVAVEQMENNWPLVGAIALGTVLLLVLAVLLVKKIKKKKQKGTRKKKTLWVILLIVLLLAGACGAAVWYCHPAREVVQTVRAYDMLKSYLDRPNRAMKLTVKAQVENRTVDFAADIDVTQVGTTQLSVISQEGRKLYYADGMVLLENGNAFRLNSTAPDYAQLLTRLPELYRLVEIGSADGVYSVTAEGAAAGELIKLLLPSVQSLLPDTGSLSVDLLTKDGQPSQIRFTGAGNLTDSVKTPFSLSAVADLLPESQVVVPQKVIEVIRRGDGNPQEVYSDDLIALMEGWAQMRGQNPLAAELEVEAEVGPLSVQDTLGYYAWRVEDRAVYGLERKDKLIYLTDSAACDADGRTVRLGSGEDMDIAKLMEALYRGFRSAQYQCRRDGDVSTYTVTLPREGIEELMGVLLPKAKNIEVEDLQGTIQLRMTNGSIESLWLSCGGRTQAGKLEAEAVLSTRVTFRDGDKAPELPEKVREALLK